VNTVQRPAGWSDGIDEFYKKVVPGLPDHKSIVEVGVWLGRSLVYLGALIKHHKRHLIAYGVDTFDGGPAATPAMRAIVARYGGSLYDEAGAGLALLKLDDVVRLIKADSVDAAKQFLDRELGLVFIDASHTFEGTVADIQAWRPKLAPGGLLAGHDVDSPGVRRAIDQELPGWTQFNKHVWSFTV
jgi:predicted O-methyltransferase YrrM